MWRVTPKTSDDLESKGISTTRSPCTAENAKTTEKSEFVFKVKELA